MCVSHVVAAVAGDDRNANAVADGAKTDQHQLETFAAAVRAFQPGQGGLVQSATGGTADDPVNTMHGIDSIYLKAGWKAREGDSGFRVE